MANKITVAIKDEITVLVDVTTKRLALRKACDGEPSIKAKLNGSRTLATIPINGALKALGIKISAAKGRYRFVVKDDLIAIQVRTS
jgi:hypothetical protein